MVSDARFRTEYRPNDVVKLCPVCDQPVLCIDGWHNLTVGNTQHAIPDISAIGQIGAGRGGGQIEPERLPDSDEGGRSDADPAPT